ncbi:hypothetical protein F750_5811 [Streptomyces sp. PAMC 26508]|nr:hypothetical protein F750_5811 [Streptomyces sp. PAMC 26508]
MVPLPVLGGAHGRIPEPWHPVPSRATRRPWTPSYHPLKE